MYRFLDWLEHDYGFDTTLAGKISSMRNIEDLDTLHENPAIVISCKAGYARIIYFKGARLFRTIIRIHTKKVEDRKTIIDIKDNDDFSENSLLRQIRAQFEKVIGDDIYHESFSFYLSIDKRFTCGEDEYFLQTGKHLGLEYL